MRIIYIRKLSYNEAKEKLIKEIQEAFLNGEKEIEVIHGIGEGILKKMTIEYVKSQTYLKLIESPDFVYNNPGSTRIEILSPDKETIQKYLKKEPL